MVEPSIKPSTLRDVAKAAGVSYQTVSRVINGNPHVSTRTLLRAQDAITRLAYQPNQAAQMLATGRSHTLEVITAGVGHYGPAQMMVGVEHAARQRGYQLIFSNMEDATVDDVQIAIDNLSNVYGVLVIPPIKSEAYASFTFPFQTTPSVQMLPQF